MKWPIWTLVALCILLLAAGGYLVSTGGVLATRIRESPTPTFLPPAATPTSAAVVANVVGGTGGSSASDPSPTSTVTPSPTPQPSPTPAATPTPEPTPSPTPTPRDLSVGPFVVKQIETLGHETISGIVCSLTQPFTVAATAPNVSWTFLFQPQAADRGTVSYAYSIPSAGESHSAKGNYTISRPDDKGTILVQFSVSDHVVFHGFDGNIPVSYKFNLVSSPNAVCAGSQQAK